MFRIKLKQKLRISGIDVLPGAELETGYQQVANTYVQRGLAEHVNVKRGDRLDAGADSSTKRKTGKPRTSKADNPA